MLEMLMLTPSNIIPADTFMDKIWGYDTRFRYKCCLGLHLNIL